MKEILNTWSKQKKAFVFLIDFEMRKPRAWLLSEPTSEIRFNFNGFTNWPERDPEKEKFTFNKSPLDPVTYRKQFKEVQDELHRGNSYLVNLTARHRIDTSLTFEQIFQRAEAPYKIWLKNEFISFSPETFVRIRNGQIFTHPMKGTIDASQDNAEHILRENLKEQAEHATIVDLLRNDLSRVATGVEVTKYRYYEEIISHDKKIGQMSSEIRGDLKDHYKANIGDLLWEMLPAGSVSGAPKAKTLEIIKNTEKEDRGYYSGVAGYFDGSDMDSCVLIRYIDHAMNYRSGGGITFMSKWEEEYQEMTDKIYVPVY